MASYICLFAMCILVATVECHVIRANKVRIPPQGLTIEILIKPDEGEDLASKVKDIFEKNEDGTVNVKPTSSPDFDSINETSNNAEDLYKLDPTKSEEELAAKIRDIFMYKENIMTSEDIARSDKTAASKDIPVIEDRLGIVSGNCPEGYVSRGGFCFPDYD